MTRPDIGNVVREVARHYHKASKKHWTAAVKNMQYLHAMKDLGLRYSRDADSTLSAYGNATHASSMGDRRSVSSRKTFPQPIKEVLGGSEDPEISSCREGPRTLCSR